MHQRFIAMQEEDSFVLEYMNLLGHREFGKGLNWLQVGEKRFLPNHEPSQIECWLEYWVYLHKSLFDNVVKNRYFVDFDDMKQNPGPHISILFSNCSVGASAEQFLGVINGESRNILTDNTIKKMDLYREAAILHSCILKNSPTIGFDRHHR
jgi:hypothetical protein